jgi:hypothetical protein
MNRKVAWIIKAILNWDSSEHVLYADQYCHGDMTLQKNKSYGRARETVLDHLVAAQFNISTILQVKKNTFFTCEAVSSMIYF